MAQQLLQKLLKKLQPKLKNVDSVVVGSYLYNALDLNKAVESLKNAEVVKEDKPAKTTKEKAKETKKSQKKNSIL